MRRTAPQNVRTAHRLLSAVLLHEYGWRAACLSWAGLNLLFATPLNWLTIPRHSAPAALPQAVLEAPASAPPRSAMPILAFFFPQRGSCREPWRAFAGFAESGGCLLNRGNCGRGAGWPGPGRRPYRRVRPVALVPPGLIGANSIGSASDRRCVSRRARCSGDHRVRAVARRRQRHDHDRQGHAAVGFVRAARVRATQRAAVCACPGTSVGSAVPIWVCCSIGSGSRPSAYRPGFISPLSARCSCCARAVS